MVPSAFIWRMRPSTCSPVLESSAPVGSSAMRMGERAAMARAMATRCCWPPESWAGRLSALAAISTFSSASMARARRSASGTRW